MAEHPFNSNRPPVPSDIEELTAYLDGELDPDELGAVERRLAEDHAYRSELQRLQKAWDALDQLPLPESSTTFTKSTIEMVVQDATREVRERKRRRSDWLWRAAAILIIPIGSFFVSQNVVQYVQNAPQRELARDLLVIENVDVYQKAQSIEFLTALAEMRLFDDEDFYFDVEGQSSE